MMTPTPKISDSQINYYLAVVQGYIPDVKLRIKRWKADYRIRYMLVSEEEDSGGWVELSRLRMAQSGFKETIFLQSLLPMKSNTRRKV